VVSGQFEKFPVPAQLLALRPVIRGWNIYAVPRLREDIVKYKNW
jgi:hypothetical protein